MNTGNRWPDACALCDRPIDLSATGYNGRHLFLGSGWVHGGGRECIPCHYGCVVFAQIDHLLQVASEHWTQVLQQFRYCVGPAKEELT
jgi:hypothetical protein